MKSTRFRGGWLHTGPSPRRREGEGAFFKVGGMRGRPGVQSGSRRLVACQHHDVPLVPRDRWIYTHSLSSPSTLVVVLSSPLVIGIQFIIARASIKENHRSFQHRSTFFLKVNRFLRSESHQTAISNCRKQRACFYAYTTTTTIARAFRGCNSASGKCFDRSIKMWIARSRSRTKDD